MVTPPRTYSNTPPTASGPTSYPIWQLRTLPVPAMNAANGATAVVSSRKRRIARIFAVALVAALAVALYVVWHGSPSTAAIGISQQGSGAGSVAASGTPATLSSQSTDSTAGTIAVYITGAVQHPGVYMVPPDARVYQVLQAAGGALPDANLVALNLAAKLSDGQEVYVPKVGESVPPAGVTSTTAGSTNGGSSTSQGQLVNINTATSDQLRQQLHVSSTTAQNIVSYRVQHGAYTSVDQLLQVVSKTIYDRIKGMVTVS